MLLTAVNAYAMHDVIKYPWIKKIRKQEHFIDLNPKSLCTNKTISLPNPFFTHIFRRRRRKISPPENLTRCPLKKKKKVKQKLKIIWTEEAEQILLQFAMASSQKTRHAWNMNYAQLNNDRLSRITQYKNSYLQELVFFKEFSPHWWKLLKFAYDYCLNF